MVHMSVTSFCDDIRAHRQDLTHNPPDERSPSEARRPETRPSAKRASVTHTRARVCTTIRLARVRSGRGHRCCIALRLTSRCWIPPPPSPFLVPVHSLAPAPCPFPVLALAPQLAFARLGIPAHSPPPTSHAPSRRPHAVPFPHRHVSAYWGEFRYSMRAQEQK